MLQEISFDGGISVRSLSHQRRSGMAYVASYDSPELTML